MSRMRFIVAATFLVGITAFGYLAGKKGFRNVRAASELNVKPFVMQYADYTVTDNRQTVTARYTKGRKSDGSFYALGTMYSPNGEVLSEFRRVDDLTNGTTVFIVDLVHAKSTGGIDKRNWAHQKESLLHPPENCAWTGDAVDGQEVMFGYTAIRVVQHDGAQSVERHIDWRLPEFSCETVQSQIQKRDNPSQPWRTTLGSQLTSFAEIQPDDKQFTYWNEYSEMKPSDIKRAVSRLKGLTPDSCEQCFKDEESDAAYAAYHAR